ncbi:MAG: Mur ligase family protein [Simkaniaceae bacterium]|nr:Mur ligase family protein [Simkaniaceae bacterium]
MKRALVIGYGISGKGAEKLLLSLGYETEISENSKEAPGKEYHLAVLSPGIHPDDPLPRLLRKRGTEVIGEAEFGLRHIPNPLIGVTGTNGKTTMVLLLAHILKGRAIGNVGESIAGYASDLLSGRKDGMILLVVELSSFQLETLSGKKFDCALITTITPDHLDRYPSFSAYETVKRKIARHVKEGGVCLAPEAIAKDDATLTSVTEGDGCLQLNRKGRYSASGSEVLALAFAVCQRFGVGRERFEESLRTFIPPPHRLEPVGAPGGIFCINDSKSTNPEATLYAVRHVMRRFPSRIFLIVGGRGKGLSFSGWREGLGSRVEILFTIGETAPDLGRLLSPFYRVEEMESLEEAVARAFREALPGDVLLLSPGCTSWDRFRDYAHRGEVFRSLVCEQNGRQ